MPALIRQLVVRFCSDQRWLAEVIDVDTGRVVYAGRGIRREDAMEDAARIAAELDRQQQEVQQAVAA